MKNSAGQGRCYPLRPKAKAGNTLRDLQNSSYPTKAEFNNCFIIHSKYFQTLFFFNFRKTAANSTAVVGFLMFFSLE